MLAHPHANDEIALAFHRLSEQAMQHYVSCQQQFSQQIAAYSQWHIDDDSGSLQLSDECLTARSYPLTAIATYIPAVQDFAWAWANDAFAAPINEGHRVCANWPPTPNTKFSIRHRLWPRPRNWTLCAPWPCGICKVRRCLRSKMPNCGCVTSCIKRAFPAQRSGL